MELIWLFSGGRMEMDGDGQREKTDLSGGRRRVQEDEKRRECEENGDET